MSVSPIASAARRGPAGPLDAHGDGRRAAQPGARRAGRHRRRADRGWALGRRRVPLPRALLHRPRRPVTRARPRRRRGRPTTRRASGRGRGPERLASCRSTQAAVVAHHVPAGSPGVDDPAGPARDGPAAAAGSESTRLPRPAQPMWGPHPRVATRTSPPPMRPAAAGASRSVGRVPSPSCRCTTTGTAGSSCATARPRHDRRPRRAGRQGGQGRLVHRSRAGATAADADGRLQVGGCGRRGGPDSPPMPMPSRRSRTGPWPASPPRAGPATTASTSTSTRRRLDQRRRRHPDPAPRAVPHRWRPPTGVGDARGDPSASAGRCASSPRRSRRLIEDRDRGCRFPGCTATRFVEIHHLARLGRGWSHRRRQPGQPLPVPPRRHRPWGLHASPVTPLATTGSSW